MSTQQLAANYADFIADELWSLDQTGDTFPHVCNCEDHGPEDCEQCPLCEEDLSAFGYLASALDIEYRVSADKDYRSALILIAFGGPNAWLDTGSRQLIVSWDERAYRTLPRRFCDELDEALEQLFHC